MALKSAQLDALAVSYDATQAQIVKLVSQLDQSTDDLQEARLVLQKNEADLAGHLEEMGILKQRVSSAEWAKTHLITSLEETKMAFESANKSLAESTLEINRLKAVVAESLESNLNLQRVSSVFGEKQDEETTLKEQLNFRLAADCKRLVAQLHASKVSDRAKSRKIFSKKQKQIDALKSQTVTLGSSITDIF